MMEENPQRAIDYAKNRKGFMEYNLGVSQKNATGWEGMRDALRKELETGTGVLDTKKLEELETINEKLAETYAQIAEYTELVAEAENERKEALKAQLDAYAKAAEELAKFREGWQKDMDRQTESEAKAESNVTKSEEDFKERMEGIKSIAMASVGRGGSLSEKLGGTSSTIKLNQKALEVQRKQLVQLEELVRVEKAKTQELVATYK
jgi:chromosome segregation ATPase